MYERNAIVLERYFDKIFGYDEKSNLTAKIIDRKPKLEVIRDQESKALKIISGLINVQGVKSLNVKELSSGAELVLNSKDKENILYNSIEWFKKLVPNISDRNNYKEMILGDLAGQKFELEIVFSDNESNRISKTYNIDFIAEPIKLTFDYGYKEVNSDSNKIDIISQNNAGLVEERPEPTLIEDGTNKYKFDGWYLKQDDSEMISETKFDFENTKVYYDTTFVAKWLKLKIVDIDEKIETSLNKVDKEKIESILNIDYRKDENIVLFECIDETKKLSDIENTGLILALDSILKEDVENIIVEINSKNYELKLGDDLISYKNKILGMINDFIGNDEDLSEEKWKDIRLTELLGKTLKITVNLNSNSIQTNNTTQEVYTVNFVEVVPKGKIIGNLLNEGEISDSIYKANYKDGVINVIPKVGDTKLSTIENSEVFKVLVNLVEDNRIEKLILKGGKDEETALDLKSVVTDTTNENTTEKLKNLLKDNWSKLCKCTDESCCKDECTWENAENDCLINSGSFDIEVVLSQQSEYELGGKRTEN